MRDYRILNLKEPIELEASLFAAEVLLDDEEILELIRNELTVAQIAMFTCTDVDFVSMKIDLLRWKGNELKGFEYDPYFLRCAEKRK